MQQVKKVVLAYSGGVDTSVCIPYLKNEYGVKEVVTFVADLGQGEDLELIRQKALNSGCLLYTSPSPRDKHRSRMPSSA